MADFNEYKGVWVFCEQRQGALMSTDFELVSEARKLADELGCEVTGLLLGDIMMMICDPRIKLVKKGDSR